MATVVIKDPVIQTGNSTKKIMTTLLIALAVLFIASVYHVSLVNSKYTVRAIGLMGSSVFSAILVEVLWFRFIKGQKTFAEIKKSVCESFPWITAMILTLSLPVWATYYSVIISTIVAITIGKLLYGGFGHNVFNPAGVGRAMYVFGISVIAVTAVQSGFQIAGAIGVTIQAGEEVAGGTFMNILGLTSPEKISASMANVDWRLTIQSIVGHWADFGGAKGFKIGAMAETSTLLLLVIGVVLAIRKVLDWRVLSTYLVTFTVWTLLSYLLFIKGATADDALRFSVMQLTLGGLMFGAVLMATDPVTMPQHPAGRVVFAMGLAFFTFLIRFSGQYPEGVLFAILIMNMLTPTIEKIFVGDIQKNLQKQIVVITSILVAMSGIIFLAVNATWR